MSRDVSDTEEKEKALERMRSMVNHCEVESIGNCLDRTEKGAVKGTIANYLTVLREDSLLKDSLRFNVLTERIDVVKNLWWNEETVPLNEEAEDLLYTYFEVYYHLGTDKIMKKALRVVAYNNKYHPIRECLNALQWDGQYRIRYLLQKYMGADASTLTYECLLHFMLGAIRRVFQPGCKYEEMLCLIGGQGTGKSTVFRFMAIRDDWFSDDIKRLDDEKVYGKLRGHWIVEMSEMVAAISAKSNEIIKSFLSRQKDTFRIPYQQYEEDRPRQCVFAGTTNKRQFIPFDRSGARRYLPIAVHPEQAEIHLLDDEEGAREYILQAWAEAMEIYRSGNYSMKFRKEVQEELDAYRENFMQEDTMAGTIQGWLDDYKGDYVCTKQIWREAFDNVGEPKKYETNEVAEIMDTKIVGWTRSNKQHRFTQEGYGQQWCWIRNKPVNETDEDGFRKISEGEQMHIPFC